jgi:hypothetical protein
MAVGVGEEPIGPAQGGGSGRFDHGPAGSGYLVEGGIDLGVGGYRWDPSVQTSRRPPAV